MAIDFKESKTRENLMRAFAGESQARNRYTIAAEVAREQGLFAVNQVFLFTADQERAHAKRFYDLLKNLSGTTIHIDGGYPVDHFDSVIELLKAAEHNEMEEYEDVYQNFGDIAKEEGFIEVASAFYQIARVEQTHAKLFVSDVQCAWMCLNCGHIHKGKLVPEVCPVCRHERGYFIPASMAPYFECEFIK